MSTRTNSFAALSQRLLANCLLLFTVQAQAEVNFSGYLKSFAVAQDNVDLGLVSQAETFQSQNGLRLKWEGFGDVAVWQVHYELSPVFTSRQVVTENSTFARVGANYRLTDIKPSLSGSDDKHQLYQNLDRFNVQFQFAAGDLTIGRQAISLGSSRIINPTDVFLPFDVRTFNQEYRTGIDAVRFQAPMGDLGELDVGIILGDGADSETSALFLQLRGNVSGKDLQFAASRFAQQTMLGVGIQSALGDFGFWAEAAYVNGDGSYARTSVGLDYAFTENLFGQVEYHFNGAGGHDPDDYLGQLQSTAYRQAGVFLLGRHYLMPMLSLQASPLVSVGIQGIYNVDDGSAFASVSAAYNVAEDVYMDFGYYHFPGETSAVSATGLEIRSEYGSSPDVVYASVRFYF